MLGITNTTTTRNPQAQDQLENSSPELVFFAKTSTAPPQTVGGGEEGEHSTAHHPEAEFQSMSLGHQSVLPHSVDTKAQAEKVVQELGSSDLTLKGVYAIFQNFEIEVGAKEMQRVVYYVVDAIFKCAAHLLAVQPPADEATLQFWEQISATAPLTLLRFFSTVFLEGLHQNDAAALAKRLLLHREQLIVSLAETHQTSLGGGGGPLLGVSSDHLGGHFGGVDHLRIILLGAAVKRLLHLVADQFTLAFEITHEKSKKSKKSKIGRGGCSTRPTDDQERIGDQILQNFDGINDMNACSSVLSVLRLVLGASEEKPSESSSVTLHIASKLKDHPKATQETILHDGFGWCGEHFQVAMSIFNSNGDDAESILSSDVDWSHLITGVCPVQPTGAPISYRFGDAAVLSVNFSTSTAIVKHRYDEVVGKPGVAHISASLWRMACHRGLDESQLKGDNMTTTPWSGLVHQYPTWKNVSLEQLTSGTSERIAVEVVEAVSTEWAVCCLSSRPGLMFFVRTFLILLTPPSFRRVASSTPQSLEQFLDQNSETFTLEIVARNHRRASFNFVLRSKRNFSMFTATVLSTAVHRSFTTELIAPQGSLHLVLPSLANTTASVLNEPITQLQQGSSFASLIGRGHTLSIWTPVTLATHRTTFAHLAAQWDFGRSGVLATTVARALNLQGLVGMDTLLRTPTEFKRQFSFSVLQRLHHEPCVFSEHQKALLSSTSMPFRDIPQPPQQLLPSEYRWKGLSSLATTYYNDEAWYKMVACLLAVINNQGTHVAVTMLESLVHSEEGAELLLSWLRSDAIADNKVALLPPLLPLVDVEDLGETPQKKNNMSMKLDLSKLSQSPPLSFASAMLTPFETMVRCAPSSAFYQANAGSTDAPVGTLLPVMQSALEAVVETLQAEVENAVNSSGDNHRSNGTEDANQAPQTRLVMMCSIRFEYIIQGLLEAGLGDVAVQFLDSIKKREGAQSPAQTPRGTSVFEFRSRTQRQKVKLWEVVSAGGVLLAAFPFTQTTLMQPVPTKVRAIVGFGVPETKVPSKDEIFFFLSERYHSLDEDTSLNTTVALLSALQRMNLAPGSKEYKERDDRMRLVIDHPETDLAFLVQAGGITEFPMCNRAGEIFFHIRSIPQRTAVFYIGEVSLPPTTDAQTAAAVSGPRSAVTDPLKFPIHWLLNRSLHRFADESEMGPIGAKFWSDPEYAVTIRGAVYIRADIMNMPRRGALSFATKIVEERVGGEDPVVLENNSPISSDDWTTLRIDSNTLDLGEWTELPPTTPFKPPPPSNAAYFAFIYPNEDASRFDPDATNTLQLPPIFLLSDDEAEDDDDEDVEERDEGYLEEMFPIPIQQLSKRGGFIFLDENRKQIVEIRSLDSGVDLTFGAPRALPPNLCPKHVSTPLSGCSEPFEDSQDEEGWLPALYPEWKAIGITRYKWIGAASLLKESVLSSKFGGLAFEVVSSVAVENSERIITGGGHRYQYRHYALFLLNYTGTHTSTVVNSSNWGDVISADITSLAVKVAQELSTTAIAKGLSSVCVGSPSSETAKRHYTALHALDLHSSTPLQLAVRLHAASIVKAMLQQNMSQSLWQPAAQHVPVLLEDDMLMLSTSSDFHTVRQVNTAGLASDQSLLVEAIHLTGTSSHDYRQVPFFSKSDASPHVFPCALDRMASEDLQAAKYKLVFIPNDASSITSNLQSPMNTRRPSVVIGIEDPTTQSDDKGCWIIKSEATGHTMKLAHRPIPKAHSGIASTGFETELSASSLSGGGVEAVAFALEVDKSKNKYGCFVYFNANREVMKIKDLVFTASSDRRRGSDVDDADATTVLRNEAVDSYVYGPVEATIPQAAYQWCNGPLPKHLLKAGYPHAPSAMQWKWTMIPPTNNIEASMPAGAIALIPKHQPHQDDDGSPVGMFAQSFADSTERNLPLALSAAALAKPAEASHVKAMLFPLLAETRKWPAKIRHAIIKSTTQTDNDAPALRVLDVLLQASVRDTQADTFGLYSAWGQFNLNAIALMFQYGLAASLNFVMPKIASIFEARKAPNLSKVLKESMLNKVALRVPYALCESQGFNNSWLIESGMSFLHWAALLADETLLRTILKCFGPLTSDQMLWTTTDVLRLSPLHLASYSGCPKIVELLVATCTKRSDRKLLLNRLSFNNYEATDISHEDDHLHGRQRALPKRTSSSNGAQSSRSINTFSSLSGRATPLITAVSFRHMEVAKTLVKLGASPTVQCKLQAKAQKPAKDSTVSIETELASSLQLLDAHDVLLMRDFVGGQLDLIPTLSEGGHGLSAHQEGMIANRALQRSDVALVAETSSDEDGDDQSEDDDEPLGDTGPTAQEVYLGGVVEDIFSTQPVLEEWHWDAPIRHKLNHLAVKEFVFKAILLVIFMVALGFYSELMLNTKHLVRGYDHGAVSIITGAFEESVSAVSTRTELATFLTDTFLPMSLQAAPQNHLSKEPTWVNKDFGKSHTALTDTMISLGAVMFGRSTSFSASKMSVEQFIAESSIGGADEDHNNRSPRVWRADCWHGWCPVNSEERDENDVLLSGLDLNNSNNVLPNLVNLTLNKENVTLEETKISFTKLQPWAHDEEAHIESMFTRTYHQMKDQSWLSIPTNLTKENYTKLKDYIHGKGVFAVPENSTDPAAAIDAFFVNGTKVVFALSTFYSVPLNRPIFCGYFFELLPSGSVQFSSMVMPTVTSLYSSGGLGDVRILCEVVLVLFWVVLCCFALGTFAPYAHTITKYLLTRWHHSHGGEFGWLYNQEHREHGSPLQAFFNGLVATTKFISLVLYHWISRSFFQLFMLVVLTLMVTYHAKIGQALSDGHVPFVKGVEDALRISPESPITGNLVSTTVHLQTVRVLVGAAGIGGMIAFMWSLVLIPGAGPFIASFLLLVLDYRVAFLFLAYFVLAAGLSFAWYTMYAFTLAEFENYTQALLNSISYVYHGWDGTTTPGTNGIDGASSALFLVFFTAFINLLFGIALWVVIWNVYEKTTAASAAWWCAYVEQSYRRWELCSVAYHRQKTTQGRARSTIKVSDEVRRLVELRSAVGVERFQSIVEKTTK